MLVIAVLFGTAWSVLIAAGIARRWIRRSLTRPMRDLFEAIGAAGEPPRDRSYQFAAFALVFFAVASTVVPAGVVFLLTLN